MRFPLALACLPVACLLVGCGSVGVGVGIGLPLGPFSIGLGVGSGGVSAGIGTAAVLNDPRRTPGPAVLPQAGAEVPVSAGEQVAP